MLRSQQKYLEVYQEIYSKIPQIVSMFYQKQIYDPRLKKENGFNAFYYDESTLQLIPEQEGRYADPEPLQINSSLDTQFPQILQNINHKINQRKLKEKIQSIELEMIITDEDQFKQKDQNFQAKSEFILKQFAINLQQVKDLIKLEITDMNDCIQVQQLDALQYRDHLSVRMICYNKKLRNILCYRQYLNDDEDRKYTKDYLQTKLPRTMDNHLNQIIKKIPLSHLDAAKRTVENITLQISQELLKDEYVSTILSNTKNWLKYDKKLYLEKIQKGLCQIYSSN
ncbi:UNKNOWN [Stylonychia lemnae]|uniref:Uncharacterized protein n=1 Tax=Stylonychia lemnae TaxID=5949 RepID=A0A078A215_STYLE|nr:UNKNOWN [Stylonychia lemnae]|eukprot:CDW75852.1 UNKNOWN [Stylonychia lemnae]